MILRTFSGFSAGFTGSAGNAWVRGASSSEIFRQGLQGALWGGGIGAVAGGISGGITARKAGLNPWTGTGWVESNSRSVNSFVPSGEPTEFDLNNHDLREYAWKNFPGTEQHLTYASCNLEIMQKLGTPIDSHFLDGLQLMAKGEDGFSFAVDGVHVYGRNRITQKLGSYIMISPNAAGYSRNLHQAMGHEIIHSFHYYSGAIFDIGSGGSEFIAYRWNASQSVSPSKLCGYIKHFSISLIKSCLITLLGQSKRL